MSLVAFLVGAFLGGRVQARVAGARPGHLVAALAGETVLGVAALVIAILLRPRGGTVDAGILIAILAAAMGIRNAAVRNLAVPDLTTTVLTLTLTGLAAEIGTDGFRRSASRRGAAVVAMLVGALIGAVLVRIELWLALAAALTLVVTTATYYVRAVRPRR